MSNEPVVRTTEPPNSNQITRGTEEMDTVNLNTDSNDKPSSHALAQESAAVDSTTGDPTTEVGFDLASIRLPQNFAEHAGVKKLLSRVPVHRPNKATWFRVRPGDEWRLLVCLLELKEHGETYAVTPAAASVIADLVRPAELHTAIDRQGNVFLIPRWLPAPDGRTNTWADTLAQALQHAMTGWTRISANMALGGYDIFSAQGELAEPVWPDHSLQELVGKAFDGRIISDQRHPVVNQLLGRV